MLTVENVAVRRANTLALEGITLSLAQGRTLAVVGESGAGKSTLIGAILGLVPCAAGEIAWAGEPVRTYRPSLVMQEPRRAFNPRLSLRRSVCEPLVAQGLPRDEARLSRLCQGLEIQPDLLDRLPSQVSIGQAQRVGILRALIASPPLVLFDEPLSALDAVTQKHTARLIAELQSEEGFAALIVTHDLGYAAAYADEIAVLKAGKIVEGGPTAAFIDRPQTEYGKSLRNAAFALGALEQVA